MPSETDPATAPGRRRNTPIHELSDFLDRRLDALVDKSIEIAKSNGYAPFTTTIRAAWVEAILSVSESLRNYLSSDGLPHAGPQATFEYGSDPRFLRMRQIARQHRSLGITQQLYLGLLKHFRNLYLAELEEMPGGLSAKARSLVLAFFDETELSIGADWNSANDTQRLRELQERARAITLDKDRYFAVFESLRNPAFLLDRAGNLVNANQATAEIFLGADAQAGEVIYLRSMRRRKTSLQNVINQITDAANASEEPIWFDTLKGRRCFDIRTRALHDAVENIQLGHVVILNDVTAHRREAEEAQQSEQGMSRFLATMSHEIRTPLHSVLGATELLRTADPPNTETYLDVIESAGRTLLQTLNNVLDYSKFEKTPPVPRPADTDLLEEITSFGRAAVVGRDRSETLLSFDVHAELPKTVHIDWGMTQQVLSNLVSNALRVDRGGGVRVSVRKGDGTGDCDTLRFDVRDHGPGLTSEVAAALFRPYERTTPHDTGNGGSGLGLAISRHLVQAMGGRIGFDNEATGTVVWFEIPLKPAPSPAEVGDAIRFEPQKTPDTAQRCLLVDDDPIGVIVTRRQLERLGLDVTIASTVQDAKELSQTAPFDIYVVDYLLPDGDGPTLVRDLKPNATDRTQFLALTANVEALAEQADVFDKVLAKPVGQTTLAAAIFGSHGKDFSRPPPKVGEHPELEGLSPMTVAAMIDTFSVAWSEFRHRIRQEDGALATSDLANSAHRLAGSCAVLGIVELEPRLRQFEGECRSQRGTFNITSFLPALDQDLTELTSWKRLNALRQSI